MAKNLASVKMISSSAVFHCNFLLAKGKKNLVCHKRIGFQEGNEMWKIIHKVLRKEKLNTVYCMYNICKNCTDCAMFGDRILRPDGVYHNVRRYTVFSDLLGSVTMFGSRILRPDGVCHNVRWSYSQIWQCSEIVFLDVMGSVTMFGDCILRSDNVRLSCS